MPEPLRTCVGCRAKLPQAALRRFVAREGRWVPDISRIRTPGRGAYLCSEACAGRVLKNKRYPGLAAAAGTAPWGSRIGLGATSVPRV